MSQSKIQLTLHRGVEGFADIQADWSQAAQGQASHFLHFPAWYGAHLATVAEPQNLLFAVARQDQQLRAVIPLQQAKLKLGPLSVPGVSLAYANEMGLCDGLIPEDIDLPVAQLLAELKRAGLKFRLFKLDCISQSSHAARWIAGSQLPNKNSHVTKFLDLSAGREQFYAGYSSKFNRNMRRKLKKAQEQGEIVIERYRNAEAAAAFDTFLQLEDSGWKGREGTSIAQQPNKLKYYQALIQGFSADGVLSVNVLTLAGKPIAAQVGVQINSTLNLLKIAYDESHSDISPGYLLIDGLIAEPDSEHYLSKVSFVTGVDWIDRWKPQCEAVKVAYASNNWLVDSALKRYLSRQSAPQPSSHNNTQQTIAAPA
ncbi:GNAT family N-acetyltransferase [Halioxenophilus aromaticivorans]|uniref:BioF2-like acetyltransferase domain-containing protein n=1 Tax=Halioxenophilus aromaticivorans TaxID=1306992 RepID=A0AAV3U8D1_9ALTE